VSNSEQCQVRVQPGGHAFDAPRGSNLLAQLWQHGIFVFNACGGQGACGRCRVLVADPHEPRAHTQPVLACQCSIEHNVDVAIPPESLAGPVWVETDDRALAAVAEQVLAGPKPVEVATARLQEPSAGNNVSDLERLARAAQECCEGCSVTAAPAVIRTLPETLRGNGWQMRATLLRVSPDEARVIDVRAGDGGGPWGVALDVGTTSMAACLVDLPSGGVLGAMGVLNPQAGYGPDVIARIIAADRGDGPAQRRLAVAAVNGLIEGLTRRNGGSPGDVVLLSVAGNPTMLHLLHGVSPKHLRLQPYVPAFSVFPVVPGDDLGVVLHPDGVVRSLPGVASYVGADVVAGVLATGMARSDRVTALIDLGTNGEIVVGNGEWLVCCAASAGPCFEGGGIQCGSPAMPGAISAVRIEQVDAQPAIETIADEPPLGICGAGLVDLLAELFRQGLVEPSGALRADRSQRVERRGDELAYCVRTSGEAGHGGRELLLAEADVRSLLQAKGAIYAGLESVLQTVGMDCQAVDELILAGGLGAGLNAENAVRIGLLPDIDRDRIRVAGNTSLAGACMCLRSEPAWEEAHEVARSMTCIPLDEHTDYMERFMAATFLPHTDSSLFPSTRDARAVAREVRA
jgi:uncharacterized 2Fe-2S/4Fe-4S cluster protein (DUF4445 family)